MEHMRPTGKACADKASRGQKQSRSHKQHKPGNEHKWNKASTGSRSNVRMRVEFPVAAYKLDEHRTYRLDASPTTPMEEACFR